MGDPGHPLGMAMQHLEVLDHRAGQRLGLGVEQHDFDARGDDPDGIVDLVRDTRRQATERGQTISLARRSFHHLTLRDVGDEGEGPQPVFRFDIAQGDLHRKLRAIASPRHEVEATTHRSRVGVLEVRGAMADMRAPQALGQQHLQRLSQQGLPRIAERLFAFPIGRGDRPPLIHDEDGVRRCFEDRFSVGLAPVNGRGGPRTLRDVSGDLGGADDSSPDVPDGRAGEGDVDPPPPLRHAHGFKVVDRLPPPNALEDVRLLRHSILGDDAHDGLADHLRRPVAEDPFSRWVPGGDDPLERLADDRVVG